MMALELMKTHVVTLSSTATLADAVDLMDLYQVSGLPVLDEDGKLCGMLTERDVVRALDAGLGREPHVAAGRVAAEPVGNWMSAPAVSIPEQAEITLAFWPLFAEGRKRIPVVDPEGKVVGTLNRIDFIQALFEGVFAP